MRVLLCYKNFSKDNSVSHAGLGITALYTSRTLIANGVSAQPLPIYGTDDLTAYIASQENAKYPVTHVLIMAQFLTTRNIALMVRKFPHIQFGVKCHSNVAFLQAEPPAIHLIREAIDLETGSTNFKFCSNNARLCEALKHMYGRPVTYLPNLYYTHGSEPVHRPLYNGGTLRIGCFGSLRIYKNFSTAVAAGIQLVNDLKVHGEIWINSGRTDGGGNVVYQTALAWTKNLPNVTLKELHWATWPEFKRVVGSMNVLMQPSFTETFNNVSADGISEGTCSVVGPSIEWVPNSWKAEPDDSGDVSRTAMRLLHDPYAAREGYASLVKYVKLGLPYWHEFLN